MAIVVALAASGFRLAARAADLPPFSGGQPIGWLGISIQEVGEELAERLAATFGVEAGTGVLVVDTIGGGPTQMAGLRAGDVIVKLDNQPIWEVRQLQKVVRSSLPGRPVRLSVLREKVRVQISVTVGQLPEAMWGQLAGERLGFLARSRSVGAQDAKKDSEKPVEEEVWVALVEPGSPAEKAGLRSQDLLARIGEREIRSLEELAKALRLGTAGERLNIVVLRDGARHVITLQVPSH